MTGKFALRAFFAALCLAVSVPASATSVRTFDETVLLDSSGRASVVWTITGIRDTSGLILLPWNFTPDSAVVSVLPEGSMHARVVTIEGSRFLALRSPHGIAADSVTLTFDIPAMCALAGPGGDFGNYPVKKKFVNTSLVSIGRLTSEFLLPPGYVVASVGETLPEKPAGESAPPYEIVRRGDRNGIAIRLDSARVGDAVSFKMKIKSADKSPVLLVLFIAFGIVYLVVFRDIVAAKSDAPASATTH